MKERFCVVLYNNLGSARYIRGLSLRVCGLIGCSRGGGSVDDFVKKIEVCS